MRVLGESTSSGEMQTMVVCLKDGHFTERKFISVRQRASRDCVVDQYYGVSWWECIGGWLYYFFHLFEIVSEICVNIVTVIYSFYISIILASIKYGLTEIRFTHNICIVSDPFVRDSERNKEVGRIYYQYLRLRQLELELCCTVAIL